MQYIFENGRITGELAHGNLPVSPDEKKGYKPVELFISSIAGCSGSLLATILGKKRIPFAKIKMDLKPTRNPEKANRIEQIGIKTVVDTKETLDSEQAEKLVQLVINNCGMIQSVISSIGILYEIEFSDLSGDSQ